MVVHYRTSNSHESFDEHHYAADQFPIRLPGYDIYEDATRLVIDDPVWGEAVVGDREGDDILCELVHHQAVRRMGAIEQLTLPKHFATIPGSFDFTRWEHAWGSVALVRGLIDKAEADGRQFAPDQVLEWQLRTLVSDLGHTAYSHLGDWLSQGYSSSEDQHDDELTLVLEATGFNDVLRKYDIEPEDVIFPDIEDFVENPSPDLCIDRLDYGTREIMRWVGEFRRGAVGYAQTPLDLFELDEQNRIVMRDQRSAKYFGLAYGLLPTEHWGHPVHRLQLQLFGELVKANVLAERPNLHPRDAIYTVDPEINATTRMVGSLNGDFFNLLLDVARHQRRTFAMKRSSEVNQWLEDAVEGRTDGFLEPLEYYHDNYVNCSLQPLNIEFGEGESVNATSDYLELALPGMKPRHVDPLYFDEDRQPTRLSEVDPHFMTLIEHNRRIQQRDYVGRILMGKAATASIRERLSRVESKWVEALARPRLDQEQFGAHILDPDVVAVLSLRRAVDVKYHY